jgi:hypothetical protein
MELRKTACLRRKSWAQTIDARSNSPGSTHHISPPSSASRAQMTAKARNKSSTTRPLINSHAAPRQAQSRWLCQLRRIVSVVGRSGSSSNDISRPVGLELPSRSMGALHHGNSRSTHAVMIEMLSNCALLNEPGRQVKSRPFARCTMHRNPLYYKYTCATPSLGYMMGRQSCHGSASVSPSNAGFAPFGRFFSRAYVTIDFPVS